jgi:hypothetical protein
MSSGTTFIIMRKSRAVPTEAELEKIRNEYKKSKSLTGEERKPPKFYDLENIFYMSDGDKKDDFGYDYVESRTDHAYDSLLEYTFNSLFSPIRDHLSDNYGLRNYDDSTSQIVIDENLAEKIRVAADYVLLGHYDPEIERIMKNDFIEPLGELSENYFRYRFPPKNGDDCDYGDEDRSYIIECLRTVMSAYLEADDRDELVLLAYSW